MSVYMIEHVLENLLKERSGYALIEIRSRAVCGSTWFKSFKYVDRGNFL